MKLFNRSINSAGSFDAKAAETKEPEKKTVPAFRGREEHPANQSGFHAGRRAKFFAGLMTGNPTARTTMTQPTSDAAVVAPSTYIKQERLSETAHEPSYAARIMQGTVNELLNFCEPDRWDDENNAVQKQVLREKYSKQDAAGFISDKLTQLSKQFRTSNKEIRPSPHECATILQQLVKHRALITDRLEEDHERKSGEHKFFYLNKKNSTERKLNALMERLYMHSRPVELKRNTLFESKSAQYARENQEYENSAHQTACVREMLKPDYIDAIPRHSNPDRSPQLNYLLTLGRMLGELPATRRAELLPDVLNSVKHMNFEKGMYSPMLMATEAGVAGLTIAQAQHAIAALGLAAAMTEIFAIHLGTLAAHIPEAILGNGVAKTTTRRSLPYLIKQGPLHLEVDQVIGGITHFEHKLHSHGLELLHNELKHFHAAMLAGKMNPDQWDKEVRKLMGSIEDFIATDLGPVLLSTKRVDLLKTILKLMPEDMQQEIGEMIRSTRVELTDHQWEQLGIKAGEKPTRHELAHIEDRKNEINDLIKFRKGEAWKMMCDLKGDKGALALHTAVLSGNADDVEILLKHRREPRRRDYFRMRKNELGLKSEIRENKYKIDPNRLDSNNRAAIHHAIENGDVRMVKALLEHEDLDLDLRCLKKDQPSGFWKIRDWSKGETPLDMAKAAYSTAIHAGDEETALAYRIIYNEIKDEIAFRAGEPEVQQE